MQCIFHWKKKNLYTFFFSRLLTSPVSSHLRGPFPGAHGSPLREAVLTQAATFQSDLHNSLASLKSKEHFPPLNSIITILVWNVCCGELD